MPEGVADALTVFGFDVRPVEREAASRTFSLTSPILLLGATGILLLPSRYIQEMSRNIHEEGRTFDSDAVAVVSEQGHGRLRWCRFSAGEQADAGEGETEGEEEQGAFHGISFR